MLPHGDWIETWSGAAVRGGREVVVPAPRSTIPVWVRRGSIVVTYPAAHVAAGLGDTPEAERPLEATLWGEPALGRARRAWPTGRRSPGGAARGRSTARATSCSASAEHRGAPPRRWMKPAEKMNELLLQ